MMTPTDLSLFVRCDQQQMVVISKAADKPDQQSSIRLLTSDLT